MKIPLSNRPLILNLIIATILLIINILLFTGVINWEIGWEFGWQLRRNRIVALSVLLLYYMFIYLSFKVEDAENREGLLYGLAFMFSIILGYIIWNLDWNIY